MKQYSKGEARFKPLAFLIKAILQKLLVLLCFIFSVPALSTSQTTLSAGDLAIIAVNPSGTDAFAFVLLKDIEINTVINFTDNGFASTTTGRTGEGFLIYTAPSAQIAGTVITWSNGQSITGTGWNSAGPTNFTLNASGDQLIAFQGNTANWGTLSGITLLFGLDYGNAGGFITTGLASASNSYQPAALNLDTNVFAFSSSNGNGYYANGTSVQTTVSTMGTQSVLLLSFANPAKWFKSSSAVTFPTFAITLLANEPASSVSGASISFTGSTSSNLVISWTNPSSNGGAKRIVVLRLNSTAAVPPTDTVSYTTTAIFNSGSGNQLTGIGNYVIYNGSGNTIAVSAGINASTDYAIDIYEFNGGGLGTGLKENYYATAGTANTNTPAGTSPTLSVSPTSIFFGSTAAGTATSTTSVTVTAANLSGNITIDAPGGYEVSLSNSPFSSLTLPSSNLSSNGGTVYIRFHPPGANGANNYTGTNGVSFDATGVATQYIDVSGNAIDAEPSAQSSVTFANVTTNSFDVNFNGGNGTKRIVLAKQGSAVNANPVDAATYSQSAIFGSGAQIGTGNYVVYSGTGNTVNVTGLLNGVAYYFAVYEYMDNNGTAGAENYLTLSPGTGSQTTSTFTYAWTGSVSNDYQVAGNWNPVRTSSSGNDILNFNTGTTITVTNLNTESLYQLNISNNTNVTLQASGSKTLTINNSYGIASGSGLILDGTNAITIITAAGATGSISGSITAQGGSHRIDAVDAGSVIFNNGSSLITGTGFSGSIFNSAGTANAIVFASGATYMHNAGANPFGLTAPDSKVNFSTGSNYVQRTILGFSTSGRTFPNLIIQNNISLSWTIATPAQIGSLTIETGSVFSAGNSSQTIFISGNISVDGTLILPGILDLNAGTGSQIISGSGTITIGDIKVNGTSNSASLSRDIHITNLILSNTSNALSINGNTLTISGAVSGFGKLTGSNNSNLIIIGTGAFGTMNFDQSIQGITNRLQNFTLTRGTSPASGNVMLGNTLEISGTLTLSNGTLNTGGFLTLVSDANGTARIASITATNANISGNVKVQRYIPAVIRRYRMLSPNVGSFTYSDLKDNIFVTGTGGVSNGFDASPNNQATVYTYQESTTGGRGWKGISNITNTLAAGQGALVFVRGDRTLSSPAWYTSPFVSQNAVTIDFIGAVNKGTITPTITYTNTSVPSDDGWNLVGNPYPSQIDWTALNKTNLDANYYILDPATGSYVADNGSNDIASGQAFFVHAIAAFPVISFSESAKVSSSPTNYFKTAYPKMQFKMVKDSMNSDIAWLEFNPAATRGFNRSEDALKFYNTVINLGFYIDSITTVQRNSIPMPAVADTFILSAYAAAGTYTLQCENVKATLPPSKNIYLLDLFNNNLVNLKTTSSYTFSISSNAASFGKRFQVIIHDPSMLPVSWLSFSGEKENVNDILLKWQTANEKNNDHFVVERSEDDHVFEEIGLVNAAENSSTVSNYHFIDKYILTKDIATVYYKIKQVDKDGRFNYSSTISIQNNLKTETAKVLLFPNPANDLVNIKFSKRTGGDIKIEIQEMSGKIISLREVPDTKEVIAINTQNLQTGIYLLRCTLKSKQVVTTKFIKE